MDTYVLPLKDTAEPIGQKSSEDEGKKTGRVHVYFPSKESLYDCDSRWDSAGVSGYEL